MTEESAKEAVCEQNIPQETQLYDHNHLVLDSCKGEYQCQSFDGMFSHCIPKEA